MNATLKKRLMTLLRVVVCVSLLWLVLRGVTFSDTVTTRDGRQHRYLRHTEDTVYILGPEKQEQAIPRAQVETEGDGAVKVRPGLKTALLASDKGYLLLYFVTFAPVPLIQSYRFQWLLRAQDIRISYWESVKLCYAGNFLNFTLVGTTGGDVFKAYYVSLHTEHKTEAVTTILLDRIVGLVGLVLMVALVVLPFAGQRLPREVVYFVLLFLAAVVAGCLLFLAPAFRALVRRSPLIDKLPLLSHLRRAESATRRLLQHKVLLFWSVAATVLIHFMVVTAAVFFAIAIGMSFSNGKWVDYYAYIASGNIIAAIPVSFMGLGTMEFFYTKYFNAEHGTLSQILLLAMSLRVVILFWSLPGALVTLTGSYRPRPAAEIAHPSGSTAEVV